MRPFSIWLWEAGERLGGCEEADRGGFKRGEGTIDDGFMDADVSSIEIDKFGRVAFSSFNFFHSPLVLLLYSAVELKTGSLAQGLFGSSGGTGPSGGGFTISLGRDGVSFIDLGPDEENKADDQIVNLVPKRIRIKGKRL